MTLLRTPRRTQHLDLGSGRPKLSETVGRRLLHRFVVPAVLVSILLQLVGPTSGAQAQSPQVGVGSGRASAKYVRVGPSRGALSLAPTVGLALSDFLNTRGRGEVRTADFAALADSVPVEVRDQLPEVKVESTDENSEAGTTVSLGTPTEVPISLSAATLHAEAGDDPFGRAVFRTAPVDLEVVSIGAGTVSAYSGFVDGGVREAVAEVRIGEIDLGGGALVLGGLTWRAVHRSGAETTETATFTVGSVSVAGQSFALEGDQLDQLGVALDAAAPALGPLGIQIQLPAERIEGGVVEMTPLRIRVANSELGIVVSPLLEAIQPGRDALVDAIRGGTEEADAAILVADVVLGVLAGGSALDIEFGGVTAQTAAPTDRFEFGSGGSGSGSGGAGASSGGSSATGGRPSVGGSTTPPALGTDGSGGSGSQPIAGGPLSPTPVSSSPVGDGGAGPLLLVGLLAVAAAVAAGIVDYRRLQRIPELV